MSFSPEMFNAAAIKALSSDKRLSLLLRGNARPKTEEEIIQAKAILFDLLMDKERMAQAQATARIEVLKRGAQGRHHV